MSNVFVCIILLCSVSICTVPITIIASPHSQTARTYCFVLIEFSCCIDLHFSYNPMGDFITACPPLDWRSPLVIDMYNDILRRLCKSFKIPLIDTNDIIGIMWDRAEDWCHFRDVSGDMETIYILDRIFA